MHECETMTSVSTQEEADTLSIHHAVEVASNGMNVHIYPQDTDVLFLALPTTPLLGDRSAAIIGTIERRHTIFLQPTPTCIYEKLGPEKSGALINGHALTGSDTTGHIHGNGEKWLTLQLSGKQPPTF